MNTPSFLRHLVLVLCLLAGFTAPLSAQETLFANLDGKYYPVRRVRASAPIVEKDGKMVFAEGRKYTLQKTDEYLPVFVELRNVVVKKRHLNMKGAQLNREFIFEATLETPYDLDDVYFALELNADNDMKTIFVQEVGQLDARHFKSVSAVLPLAFDLDSGKYKLHLFSGSREVFQSKIPPQQREAALDRMIARRIAGVQDAPPQVLCGPGPEYPSDLLQAKTRGQAIISIHIDARGQVSNPAVKSAAAPAFGEAALAAVRQWRFVPEVKGGRPVEAQVDLPFDFTPPEKKS